MIDTIQHPTPTTIRVTTVVGHPATSNETAEVKPCR